MAERKILYMNLSFLAHFSDYIIAKYKKVMSAINVTININTYLKTLAIYKIESRTKNSNVCFFQKKKIITVWHFYEILSFQISFLKEEF